MERHAIPIHPVMVLSAGMRRRLKGIGGLVACLLAIWAFMFHIGPWLEQGSALKPIAEFIDERNIDANMYFYTEVEEFFDANVNMQNTMTYPPQAVP